MTSRGRIVASLGALAFGILVIGSGLDRMAIASPGFAQSVPEAFRSNAWRSSAATALSRGDAEAAGRLAERAVQADPLDPRNASALGAARLALGENSGAESAFAVADRMGLRTPLTQAFFFDAALARGDVREAARRVDILLRSYPILASEGFFFAALEQTPSGRRELIDRLKSQPLWSQAYLSAKWGSDEVLMGRARFLATEAEDLYLGCDRIDPMLRALAERNLRREAQVLAQAQCPERAASQAIADPGFEQFGDSEGFGWRKQASGDLRLVVVGKRDRRIEMQNRSGVTRLALSQPVALAPGELRIFASVESRHPDALVASLDCGSPSRPTRSSGELGRGQLLKAPDCPDQVLGIWLRPGSGTVRLDDLRVEQVRAQVEGVPASRAE